MRRFAVPIILVLVAMNQLALAHTGDLTPWKGGGFGMFASMDHLDTRFVRIELVTAAGESVSVAIDAYAEVAGTATALDRARAMPDGSSLRRIAGDVDQRRWRTDGEVAIPLRAGPHPPIHDDEIEVRNVRVSVWVFRFDRRQRALVPELVATHETAPP